MVLESPSVQTALVRKITEAIKSSINGEIHVGAFELKPVNHIILKDVDIIDTNPWQDSTGLGYQSRDTLLHIGYASGSFTIWSLLAKKGIKVSRLRLDDVGFHLVSEPGKVWRNNLTRIFKSPPPPDTPRTGPELFTIKHLEATDVNFSLTNMVPTDNVRKNHIGLNFRDLDLNASVLNAHDVHFGDGRLRIKLDELALKEKSGFDAERISGWMLFGGGNILIHNFNLVDQFSNVVIPNVRLTFANAAAMQDFTNKVRMHIDIVKTSISGQTLKYFINALPDNHAIIDLDEVHITGLVNDMDIKTLRFKEQTSGISFDGKARLTDVEDLPEMGIDATVRSIKATTAGATALVRAIVPGSKFDVTKIAPGEAFVLKGTASGKVRNLRTKLQANMGSSSLDANLLLANMGIKSKALAISGTASTDEFNLGALLKNDKLGPVTAHTGLRAEIVPGETALEIDSLVVDKLSALGYDYSGIMATGTLQGRSFDGKVVCDDPNLNLLFQGVCNFSPASGDALYKFYADIGFADLKALNLDKRDVAASAVSCMVTANYRVLEKGDGIGEIKVKDLTLDDGLSAQYVGNITMESKSSPGSHSIRLKSGFADADFSGSETIASMVRDLQDISVKRHLPSLFPASAPPQTDSTGDYSLSLKMHDSRKVLPFVKPGLYIADSTNVQLKINGNGNLLATVNSPRLALGRNYIKGSDIRIDNEGDRLNAVLNNAEMRLAGSVLHKTLLTATARRDSVNVLLHCDGDGAGDPHGDLKISGSFSRDGNDSLSIAIEPRSSEFYSEGNLWKVADSRIRIAGGKISVNDFILASGDQYLILNGGISRFSADTLNLDAKGINLGMASSLSGKQVDLGGNLNGTATLVSPTSGDMQVTMDMHCDTLRVGDNQVGTMSVKGNWDKVNNRLNIDIRDTKDGKFPLIAKGYVYPNSKELDFSAALDGLNIAVAQPFLSSIFSEMGGYMSGTITASGNLSRPDIRSSGLMLDSAMLRLDSTGAAYTLSGPIALDNSGIRLVDIKVRDEQDGEGTLTGGLSFENFEKEMALDARLQMKELQLLNLKEGIDNSIYGKMSASGLVNVTGPLDDLNIGGFVTSEGKGEVHVGLNSAFAEAQSDLLTFKEEAVSIYIDPYDEMMNDVPETTKKKHKGNIKVRLRAGVTPEVKAFVELNKSTGNIITANGNAAVTLDVETAKKQVSLVGDYTLNQGNLHFEIPGIVKKEFELNNGSTIKFNGNPKDSELNISASYKLKTSLSNLLSDTTSVGTRRLVVCSIDMSGNLRNPAISFGIDVPDLDPGSRSKMAEALNTEDKVQKQFMALLVMGNFMPNEMSGVFNGSNILYSNFSQIMSSQVNNILQKLNIPLDLGLGYQQTNGGTDIFDLAISTQLFNNRVEIGGTVGNRQYKTSKNPNGDVVGDIDISIKLDKPGKVRLNLFSHSADEYSSFLDLSQRNGVGINYSMEYDNFWQMLGEIFKKKKNQDSEEKQVPDRNRERTVIKIEQ